MNYSGIHFLRTLLLCLTVFGLALPATAGKPKGDSGLPIPRFVSLKSAEVNVRSGPGTRYPITWVYRRENLPVEVIEEFDYWRKIKDVEGTSGWVHKQMIDGTRSMLTRSGIHTLYSEPDDTATPTLKAEAGVIGKLLECTQTWCRVQISGRKAWIQKSHIYGVYPDETYKK
jgi:SH3-like domain-containing protein